MFLFFPPQDGQSRTVRQFQFTDWPEQGVPKSGEGFIDFIGQVHKTKEQFGQDGPISVHCRYVHPNANISCRFLPPCRQIAWGCVKGECHTLILCRREVPQG